MRQTNFRTVTGGEILRKWTSSASHALAALLLAPKLLRPGKSQETTVGILPNKHSQLARYFLVWGIRPVCSPTTVGQVMVKACFTGYGAVHRLSVFFSLMIMYYMQVPN